MADPNRAISSGAQRAIAAVKAAMALDWDAGWWSDDPVDPCYNRPICLPHPFSTEALIRDDPLYDIIMLLGHNDRPPKPGQGSAIFFHIWNDAKPTEGCIAIARPNMDDLLPALAPGDIMDIF